jgi:hypothetical protein
MAGFEMPMIETSSNSYIEIEIDQVTSLFGEYVPNEETSEAPTLAKGEQERGSAPA